MGRKKEKKWNGNTDEVIELDIPDDEIWTYQIEGMKAPHINKPHSHFMLKKVIFTIGVILAASLSIFFSVQVLQGDTLAYHEVDNGYMLSTFKNTGYITEINIDYVRSIEYDKSDLNPETNFSFKADESKPVTEIREYAFNCDEKLQKIYIGPSVEKIDSKSLYTCRMLQYIEVDDENPNYCDIDGVLYTKDLTEVVCYPMAHWEYLEKKLGWENGWPEGNEEEIARYSKEIQTYVLPSSVKKMCELSFNYANLEAIYMPEGLETIETMAMFKIWNIRNIYTYTTDEENTDTSFTAIDNFKSVYKSLPNTLKYIGSDAFNQNQSLSYMYIPKSVEYIGHHAFFSSVYEENGEWKGITEINVEADEETFKNVKLGDQWRSEFSFLKYVPINYSATRAE